jgi:hypothetical protein
MIDLYLDPEFTVEGNDFVFKAHDDDKKDYIVCVAFDDLAAFIGFPAESLDIEDFVSLNTNDSIHDSCQQIVDRYQTGTTSYDVDVERKRYRIIIGVGNKEYILKSEDELKAKGRNYNHIRGDVILGKIPYQVVHGTMSDLNQTSFNPITYKVR